MVATNPYAGMVSSLDAREFELLRTSVAERRCRELVGAGTPAEAAELWRPNPSCPSRQARRREMAQNRKGPSPFAYG